MGIYWLNLVEFMHWNGYSFWKKQTNDAIKTAQRYTFYLIYANKSAILCDFFVFEVLARVGNDSVRRCYMVR